MPLIPWLDFDRVKWSGGNSALARAQGVKEFEKLAAAHTEPPLFIVSHGHGANVVLQSDDSVRNRVKLLVCLNSPILNAKRFKTPLPVSIALRAWLAPGIRRRDPARRSAFLRREHLGCLPPARGIRPFLQS